MQGINLQVQITGAAESLLFPRPLSISNHLSSTLDTKHLFLILMRIPQAYHPLLWDEETSPARWHSCKKERAWTEPLRIMGAGVVVTVMCVPLRTTTGTWWGCCQYVGQFCSEGRLFWVIRETSHWWVLAEECCDWLVFKKALLRTDRRGQGWDRGSGSRGGEVVRFQKWIEDGACQCLLMDIDCELHQG